MDHSNPAPATTPAKAQRVLVLQGGGALGSYQAGAFQALCRAGFEPEWVAGISIGAINAAIIAGNEAREARRSAEGILGDGVISGVVESGDAGRPRALAVQRNHRRADRDLRRARLLHAAHSAGAACGRRAARNRRAITTPRRLKKTLERLVDFDRINDLKTRLSVGAVGVTSGNFKYFDNFEFRKLGKKIGPEHIMASGALPPGFPSVEIEGEHYWDGGIASNTPLDHRAGGGVQPRSPDLPGRSVQRARRPAGRRCSRPPSAKRTSAFPAAPA